MLQTAAQPTAPIVIANAPKQHTIGVRKNVPITEPIEDTKNVPPKGLRTPEEYSPDLPIISQEYDDKGTEEGKIPGSYRSLQLRQIYIFVQADLKELSTTYLLANQKTQQHLCSNQRNRV